VHLAVIASWFMLIFFKPRAFGTDISVWIRLLYL